jgi:hypothetical protein
MIDRFSRFAQVDGTVADKEFSEGMKLFAKAYAGRVDDLVDKLQELSAQWNKPTTLETCMAYFKAIQDVIVTTTTKTIVETAMRIR